MAGKKTSRDRVNRLKAKFEHQNWFAVGAFAGAIGVALGAFGAHALKSRVTEDLLAVFETGVRYQMYHALAML